MAFYPIPASDMLILSGCTSFLGNQSYWTSVPADPNATPIRREFAELIQRVDKIVVSDKIQPADLAPWDNTRISPTSMLCYIRSNVG